MFCNVGLFVDVNMLTPSTNLLNLLRCQMACTMSFEPQNPTIFHPWGCPCSILIEGDFVCRTPTLAKYGGEAQHLEKLGFGVLRDSRMFRARQQGAKHLALWCFWCHWKRSSNVDIENALALAIRTFVAQVMGKRKVES
jgi:hypothetical protein